MPSAGWCGERPIEVICFTVSQIAERFCSQSLFAETISRPPLFCTCGTAISTSRHFAVANARRCFNKILNLDHCCG